jgi:hypothetical protein|eukprot:m.139707 g.139707  ORF g.139707 m.139707 type:complete len:54 (+) comp22758_c0_seq1:161-322(+)
MTDRVNLVRYRNYAIATIKGLKSLDFSTVTAHDKDVAERWRQAHGRKGRKIVE